MVLTNIVRHVRLLLRKFSMFTSSMFYAYLKIIKLPTLQNKSSVILLLTYYILTNYDKQDIKLNQSEFYVKFKKNKN